MYDEVRKPRLLKDIPTIFIRSLPAIYYFNKFADSTVPEKAKLLFDSNINFLSEALTITGQQLKIKKFDKISDDFNTLKKEKPGQFTEQLQAVTELLSKTCTTYKQEIRSVARSERTVFTNLYMSTVLKLKILIIKVDENLYPVNKIVSKLANNCQYDVDIVSQDASDSSAKIIESDSIVFTSTNTPEIHTYVKVLNSYNKPGIILVPMMGKIEFDRASLRHGSQLQKAGHHVIFKSFTPIRLFTSIDKEYMRRHLCP